MTEEESLLHAFAEAGVVRLDRVFGEDDAAAMRDAVWRDWFHTDGIRREDPSTWRRREPFRKLARAKRDPAFHAILGPSLQRLADSLLGPGWVTSGGFGNLLASFADAERWYLPGHDALWHLDSGFGDAMDPLPRLRVFAVFGELPPGCGGTLLVAGSHRMVQRFADAHPEADALPARDARVACFRSNEWLADLTLSTVIPPTAGGEDEGLRRRRFMDTTTDVDGIPARVVEVCGTPGTVFVCHPWIVHCRPPHAGSLPRFVRSPTLTRVGEG